MSKKKIYSSVNSTRKNINNNGFNNNSYFVNSSHERLLNECKIGALERIKYNFINNIIKPHLLDPSMKKRDPNLVDSKKEYLRLLTLIFNFASYGFYYYLDSVTNKGGRDRRVQIFKLRSQMVEWIDFNDKNKVGTYYYNVTNPTKMINFKKYMKGKPFKELEILLKFINSKPTDDNYYYMDDVSRQSNLFIFSIPRYNFHGYSSFKLDGKKEKKTNIDSFSYKNTFLKSLTFQDFLSRNIKTMSWKTNDMVPSEFLSNATDKTEPFTKLISDLGTFNIRNFVRKKMLSIGKHSIFGGIHKPILEINSMFESGTNKMVKLHSKMSIKRNYTLFNIGDIVRIYSTQNRIKQHLAGKLEAKGRGASGTTYGGHMAIEIEHFYINNGERKSDLYSFGFASGSYLDEDEIGDKGFVDKVLSRIPIVGQKINELKKFKGGAIYTPDFPLLGKTMAQLNIGDRAPKFNYIELVATGLLNHDNLTKLKSQLDEININNFYGSKLYQDSLNIKNISDYLTEDELKIVNRNNIEKEIRLGNLHYDVNLLDGNEKTNQQYFLDYLKCNTFYINTITYYWGVDSLYCEMTRRDATKGSKTVYNCTSWADSVFDDIIECEISKVTSAPDRCRQSKTYPFKGCTTSGELIYEHKGTPFGPKSKKMKKLMNKSRIMTLGKSSYFTRTPGNAFYDLGKKKGKISRRKGKK